MPTNPHLLALGNPDFAGTRLTALTRGEGVEAAWRMALQGDCAAALARMGGDFAVGWRDTHGRTVLAVDRFAIRSICWRIVGGELRFAARADELADAHTAIDPQAVFDYLFFHAIPSPRTIYEGIYRLPPAHWLVFDGGVPVVQPYWTPEFLENESQPFGAQRDRFRGLLKDAVARQLDSGIPACFLSGGTDSSTVAGMIGQACGRTAHTYSIGFEAQGYDEMAFARIAAKHFKTEHHEYYVTPADLVAGIAQVAGHYDQPFGNSSALPAYYCALRAREDGVTQMLAGDGGDELFGGNSRYAKQRVFGWYGALPGPLRSGVMEPLFERSPLGKLPLLKKGTSYIEQAKVPMPDRLHMYNLLLRLGVQDVLTPAFCARVDVHSPLRQQREVWAAAKAGSDVNRTLAYDWRYTLAESDLPKVNLTTQLAGVGVGYPFLDRALLDFSLALPPADKLRGLKLRWFFKEALRGFLPDEIITKKKQGFGLPFGVWVVGHAPLKALAVDSLASLSTRGVVRAAFIKTLVEQRLPEHPGYYGEMVWILMMLEQWLQRHAPAWRLAD
jgi:asparagine synthase (glutamine-hydrolysing)